MADATVHTTKRVADVDLCSLLTPAEIVEAMGRNPIGPPRASEYDSCTWSFTTSLPDIRDSIMVSGAGRSTGKEVTIKANSALVTPSGLGCTVSIAVAERKPGRVTTDQLSVRYTNELQNTDQHCAQARELAGLAFDRLPDA